MLKYLPAIFIGLVIPLIYVVVFTVLGIIPTGVVFSQDLVTLVVTAVVSGLLGTVAGYAVGTSNSSAQKNTSGTIVNRVDG